MAVPFFSVFSTVPAWRVILVNMDDGIPYYTPRQGGTGDGTTTRCTAWTVYYQDGRGSGHHWRPMTARSCYAAPRLPLSDSSPQTTTRGRRRFTTRVGVSQRSALNARMLLLQRRLAARSLTPCLVLRLFDGTLSDVGRRWR